MFRRILKPEEDGKKQEIKYNRRIGVIGIFGSSGTSTIASYLAKKYSEKYKTAYYELIDFINDQRVLSDKLLVSQLLQLNRRINSDEYSYVRDLWDNTGICQNMNVAMNINWYTLVESDVRNILHKLRENIINKASYVDKPFSEARIHYGNEISSYMWRIQNDGGITECIPCNKLCETGMNGRNMSDDYDKLDHSKLSNDNYMGIGFEYGQIFAKARANVEIYDFSYYINNSPLLNYLKLLDEIYVVIDPRYSILVKSIAGIEYFLELREKGLPIIFVVNKLNDGVNKRELRKLLAGGQIIWINFAPPNMIYSSEQNSCFLWEECEDDIFKPLDGCIIMNQTS